GPNGLVGLNVALGLDASGTRTVARLTFPDGSLVDDKYLLTLNAAQVVDGNGQPVGADGITTVATLYRFPGVNLDQLNLRARLLKNQDIPGFPGAFDSADNSLTAGINLSDLEQQQDTSV